MGHAEQSNQDVFRRFSMSFWKSADFCTILAHSLSNAAEQLDTGALSGVGARDLEARPLAAPVLGPATGSGTTEETEPKH